MKMIMKMNVGMANMALAIIATSVIVDHQTHTIQTVEAVTGPVMIIIGREMGTVNMMPMSVA